MNFLGSTLKTPTRNSVMVMVSIVGQQKWEPIWQRLSKAFSVTVFVFGTAVFACVTLLSLIMAVVVLTLTLAAGIFGRAITSWIVSHVAGTVPMIHIISQDRSEALQAIAGILSLKSNDGMPFQVEINGHILVNERRVATRSMLKVAMFGVLAEPYDLAELDRRHGPRNGISGISMPLRNLSSQVTSNLIAQQSVHSVPSSNAAVDDESAQILSRPGQVHDLERQVPSQSPIPK
jgi:hypothetical protein